MSKKTLPHSVLQVEILSFGSLKGSYKPVNGKELKEK